MINVKKFRSDPDSNLLESWSAPDLDLNKYDNQDPDLDPNNVGSVSQHCYPVNPQFPLRKFADKGNMRESSKIKFSELRTSQERKVLFKLRTYGFVTIILPT